MLVSLRPARVRLAIVLREKNNEFELRHIKADNRPDGFSHLAAQEVRCWHRRPRCAVRSNAITSTWTNDDALHPADRSSGRSTAPGPTMCELRQHRQATLCRTEADYDKAVAEIPVPFERLEKALESRAAALFNGANTRGRCRLRAISAALHFLDGSKSSA